MAANPSPGLEDQPALFDTDMVPLTVRDSRTVGEMLVDVDHTARTMLMDVTADDAGALLHGWPHVVSAAAELWDRIPGTRGGPVAHERDQPMQRLSGMATAIETSLASTHWPKPGPPDARLTEISETLARAGDLVGKYGEGIDFNKPHVREDLDAARTRVMHGLYVTAHAIGVSLNQFGRERAQAAAAEGRPLTAPVDQNPHAVAPTTAWTRRIAICEAAAGSYLTGRIPAALAGAATTPPEDGRLGRALARWDIQAHRTLATQPTAANLVVITRTQALIAGGTLPLLAAAQHAGILEHPDRLHDATSNAGRAWSNLGGRWTDLASPVDRLDPKLATASAEVRAALRELTHDSTTLASPQTIAANPALPRALTAALAQLEAAPELAYVVAEKAEAPGLTGRARALSIRAHNDVEAGRATQPAEHDVVWVSPADIVAKRTIPLPPPVAEALQAAGQVVAGAASASAAAAGARAGDVSPRTAGVDQHADSGPTRKHSPLLDRRPSIAAVPR